MIDHSFWGSFQMAHFHLFEPFWQARSLEAKDLRVEIQFSVQHAPDVLLLPESMLLPFEHLQRTGNLLLAADVEHHLSLVGRHNLVFQTLEEAQGNRQLIQILDRRTLLVDGLHCWIRSHQIVQISRLELVGVTGERFKRCDTVEAASSGEDVREGERGQGGVPSGGSAVNGQAFRIHEPFLCQVRGCSGRVLHIHDTPRPFQQLPVLSSVSC
mmetsp:Transcript_9379/g.23316  ORF Transcript_9379/g.23316 Transcript_9379/m.23316 type:complete len:213 (+) Transcript_9379:326-964(+)